MPSLAMWTIYHPPVDYPAVNIVRRWLVEHEGGGPMAISPPMSIPNSRRRRDAIPPEADTCMPRTPSDEPSIVETWS